MSSDKNPAPPPHVELGLDLPATVREISGLPTCLPAPCEPHRSPFASRVCPSGSACSSLMLLQNNALPPVSSCVGWTLDDTCLPCNELQETLPPTATPITPVPTAAVETIAPLAETEAPAAVTEAPVLLETPAPAAATTAPMAETTAPALATVAPGATVAPAETTLAPAGATPAPGATVAPGATAAPGKMLDVGFDFGARFAYAFVLLLLNPSVADTSTLQ